MIRCLSRLSLAALAGAFVLAPAAPARAVLMLRITDIGFPTITITDNGTGDASPTVGSIDAAAYVSSLVTNYTFSSLGATSSIGFGGIESGPANLTQTLNATPTAGGGGMVTVAATDTGYTMPPNPTSMDSSATANYTSTTGTRSFDSYFNPTNAPFATDVPAPTITQNNAIGTGLQVFAATTSTGVPSVTPFGLTNVTIFKIPKGASRNLQTTGSTIINGTAVPEPSTVVTLLAGLPLAALGLRRGRRRAS